MHNIVCDCCRGSGSYATDRSCVRCNSKGVLTPKRIQHLREVYFPKRLANGSISQQVFDKEMAHLAEMLAQCEAPILETNFTPSGAGPLILTDLICAKYGIGPDTTMREMKTKFPAIYVEEF